MVRDTVVTHDAHGAGLLMEIAKLTKLGIFLGLEWLKRARSGQNG